MLIGPVAQDRLAIIVEDPDLYQCLVYVSLLPVDDCVIAVREGGYFALALSVYLDFIDAKLTTTNTVHAYDPQTPRSLVSSRISKSVGE